MHLPTHLAISWLVGSSLPTRRARVVVAWLGVAPDLDAASALFGEVAFSDWHHTIAHNLWFALFAALLAAIVERGNWRVAAFAFLAVHVHFLCDLFGSGGDWTIPYLYPLGSVELISPIRWALNSWPNMAITLIAFVAIGRIGIRKGYTVVETFLPKRVDEAVVEVLRRRFVWNYGQNRT